jgi:hypothetical protein
MAALGEFTIYDLRFTSKNGVAALTWAHITFVQGLRV